MEKSSNGLESKHKTPNEGFFDVCKRLISTFLKKKNNTIYTALIAGLILVLLGEITHLLFSIFDDSNNSKTPIINYNHSNNVKNIYSGGITINNIANSSKKGRGAAIRPLARVRVITNYSELNSVISKNLNAILKNNTKDTLKLMFTYPPGAFSESNGSAEYSPGELTVYSSCGQIIIENCHLPWVPEFRDDVVKAQARRNIDSLVIGEIGYICKKLKQCLNQ